MAEKSNINSVDPNSSAPKKKPEPTGSSAMTREQCIKALSENPATKLASPSGRGFIIGGVKR